MNPERTDWDGYYERPFPAASVTRRYTGYRLSSLLRRFLPNRKLRIAELGGANSCFYQTLASDLNFSEYRIVDNNPVGLKRSEAMSSVDSRLAVENHDVLTWKGEGFDLVYSIGLIEHFDHAGTAEVVRRHFMAANPGGLVLISVPTPTLPYRVTRSAAEIFGLWKFPDERAMDFTELHETAASLGTLLHKEILWPLILTQVMAAYRTSDNNQHA
jgi:SAM-dependent methyltransferase